MTPRQRHQAATHPAPAAQAAPAPVPSPKGVPMTYLPGERVVLVRTSDPYTRLIPGTMGTVARYDAQHGQLAVHWDDGSTLAMLLSLSDGDQVRPLDIPGPQPEAVRSDDGRRLIEIIPRANGSYHVVIRSASTGQVITQRFPATAPRMQAVVLSWAYDETGLDSLAEAVRCHVPVQPDHPRHGTAPVPVEMYYGPLPDGTGQRRCGWTARFVTSLAPGGHTRNWGWASGQTLAGALLSARDVQRSATPPPDGPR
jgi:hypothetical protein